MRIVCPFCSATYDVPESLLLGRKAVSCARCGKQWQPEVPSTGVASAQARPIAPPAATAPPAPAPPPEQPVMSRLEAAAGARAAPPGPHPPPMASAPQPRVPIAGATARPPAPRPAAMRSSMSGGALAIDRLMAAPQPKPPASLALRIAWVLSVVLVIAVIAGAFAWRSDVMAAWPPSTRLYSALGLAD